MSLTHDFLLWCKQQGVEIRYWQNLSEIIYLTEADVFIDEVLKYFDARGWEDLSQDAKHFLTQGAKSGIHVYGAAQDLSQVDKSFRLLLNRCYFVKKVVGSPRPMKTAPPVRWVWGLCMLYTMDSTTFKGDSVTMKQKFIGRPFLILKKDCQIFDTGAKVTPTALPPLIHSQRVCPVCGKVHVSHK